MKTDLQSKRQIDTERQNKLTEEKYLKHIGRKINWLTGATKRQTDR